MGLETRIFTGVTTSQIALDFSAATSTRDAFIKWIVLYAVGANTNFTILLQKRGAASPVAITVLAVLSGATQLLTEDDLFIDIQRGDRLFVQSSVAASVITLTIQDYDK